MTAHVTALELTTIIVHSPTDFTGPLIGIGGVLIGSFLGFWGLRWQHTAQKQYDLRKLAAELLARGEELKEAYVEKRNGGVEVRPFVAMLGDRASRMMLIQRHLELMAPRHIHEMGDSYCTASKRYAELGFQHHGLNKRPDEKVMEAADAEWSAARENFISAVKSRWGIFKKGR